MNRILLFGNPNVGKSVIFSRLTGIDVLMSNYPGTTVELKQGTIKLKNKIYQIIDIPGTYSLSATNKAEEVAINILSSATKNDIILVVIDSTNLERNLFLTLEILKKKLPTILVLNKWDLTQIWGTKINIDNLSKMLDVVVVPVVGISGDGIKNLVETLTHFSLNPKISSVKLPEKNDNIWKFIGKITFSAQTLSHKHPSSFEKLQELTITMPYALIIALSILIFSFIIIRFLGENLTNYFLDPIFNKFYMPFVKNLAETFITNKHILKLLLGNVPEPMESFGILTTGLYVPFVIVLPYIFSFYLILSFLEDSGYLVRVAVVLDNFFHKFGLHGYASIPILLGLGCKVPAVLSTRILENEREKIISVVLILMLTPCLPQSAMIFSILSRYGFVTILSVFFILIFIGLVVGFFLNKILKGETPELFVEMPSYQLPPVFILLKKLYIRMKSFLFESVPMIIFGIFIVNIFDLIGIMHFITKILGPIMTKILGLPDEISIVMISGFLRKDVSIALLTPFDLSLKQTIISCVVLVIYLPCIATFFMLLKEFKLKKSLIIVSSIFLFSMIIGAMLNILL